MLANFLHFLSLFQLLSRGLRDSISRCVVPSICRSVPPLLFRRFRHFASSFRITAPAQSHVTDAAVYTLLLTAPAHHITTPAQPPWLRVSCIRPCFNKSEARIWNYSQITLIIFLKKSLFVRFDIKTKNKVFFAKTAICCLLTFVYTFTKKKLLQPKTCHFCLFFPFFTSKGALPNWAKKS